MTYKTCKTVIIAQKAKGTLIVSDMEHKLEVFYLAGRLSDDEYEELTALLAE